MYTHHYPSWLVRAFDSPRVAAGALLTLALFTAACGDSASGINGPSSVNSLASLQGPSAPANDFAVLANASVTCTDGTITGNVGTFLATPTGSITLTTCPVTGTLHVGDGVATAAFATFLSTYAALAPKVGDVCTTLTGTLDGVILSPGTYCFDAAATLTGVLTLNGPSNGTWTFKIGTLGTGALTGTSFTALMAGGAQPCNVTWWVAEAATMTDSHFIGTILAGAAITLTRGVFDGNAYSKADVTITGTAVTGCAGGAGNGGHHDKCDKGEDNAHGGDDSAHEGEGTSHQASVQLSSAHKGDSHDDCKGEDKEKCNQGVGNGSEGCDPGHSDHNRPSNDEHGGSPGAPGRKVSH
jgi:hypothetical protein